MDSIVNENITLTPLYTITVIVNGNKYTLDENQTLGNLGSVGYSKPEKEIFDIACKIVDLKPENCIMIGDKFKVDIQGALNAGMQAIWVNRKKEKLSYEYQIKELNELTKYL